ncbi:hypothetical protein HPP92_007194 [Vanilla planifolia]|uniref:Uncharacterized protein n=1 Tax=Vanilla planifolia TaxID=51239 RepID=A0A835RDE0_VANPL|nr:hypothetical protein HPP92_007194 [Vanilla planifolia]
MEKAHDSRPSQKLEQKYYLIRRSFKSSVKSQGSTLDRRWKRKTVIGGIFQVNVPFFLLPAAIGVHFYPIWEAASVDEWLYNGGPYELIVLHFLLGVACYMGREWELSFRLGPVIPCWRQADAYPGVKYPTRGSQKFPRGAPSPVVQVEPSLVLAVGWFKVVIYGINRSFSWSVRHETLLGPPGSYREKTQKQNHFKSKIEWNLSQKWGEGGLISIFEFKESRLPFLKEKGGPGPLWGGFGHHQALPVKSKT